MYHEDWQGPTAGEPRSSDYIAPNVTFNELDMSLGRPGRRRLHYFYESKIDQIGKFLESYVIENDNKLLQLPHALTNAAAGAILPFAGVSNPE